MKLKKKLLEKSRLYVILDKEISGSRPVFNTARQIKNTTVDIIQLRDKESKEEDVLKDAFILQRLFLSSGTLFIVNDYLDIAKISGADGFHLGQGDVSLKTARKTLGEDKIIGVSCHNLRQCLKAQSAGADYISIGPVFATPVKAEYRPLDLNLIKEVKKNIKVPFFAIGGINLENINQVLALGVKRAAVCRAILQAGDIGQAARDFFKILHR